MKLIGKFLRFAFTEKGDIEATFVVSNHFLQSLQKLDKERLLDIKVDEKKSQRSLDQNRLLWKLIHEIDVHENGNTDKDSEMYLYMNLIKGSRIELDYLQGLETMKEPLERVYRVVEVKERRRSEKGVETCVFACYKGSSHFTVEEMSRFIDYTLGYASKLDIEIAYYQRELNG